MNLRNFSIIFLTALVTIVFINWFLSPIIASGDNWFYFQSMYDNHFVYPYAWYKLAGTGGLGSPGFPFIHTNVIVGILLSFSKNFGFLWQDILRIFLYGGFLLSAISVSVYVSKKLLPNNIFWIIAPIIFLFNTYILMTLSGGLVIIGLAYSLIPLLIYLFIKLVDVDKLSDKKSLTIALSASLVLAAQTFFDLRVAIITSLAVLIYLLFSIFFNFDYKKLINFIIPFIFVFLINLYWIIPVFIGGVSPVGQLGSDYTSKEILEFLSFAKLENTISLLHPYWPDNIFGKISFLDPAFLIFPLLAFSSPLFINKKNKDSKLILYFSLIGLIGIFLAKGANFPIGNIYVWLFENIPGFQLFRDSFKWYMLIIISFMFLIPYSLNGISGYVQKKVKNKYIDFIIIISFIILFVILIRPAFIGDLPGTFQKRTIPKSYIELDKYLSDDEVFFRTLWVPNTMLFSHYTNKHPIISARDFYQEYDLNALASIISSESSKIILDEASVKYVIIPEDSEEQIYLTDRKYDENKYKQLVQILDESNYLQKEKEIGNIVIYKTPIYKDLFWVEDKTDLEYEFVNPTKYLLNISGVSEGDLLIFSEKYDSGWIAKYDGIEIASTPYNNKFNSFILPQGSYELEVYYKYQSYVDIGLILSLTTLFTTSAVLVIILVKQRRK